MASIESYRLADNTIRWMVRYRVDGRQVKSKGHRTKRDAKLFAAQTETKSATGQLIDPRSGQVTVGTLYPTWLAGLVHIKRTTRATRQTTWRAHVRDRWEHVEVGRIRPSQVRSWVAQLANDGAGVGTIENCLGVLRGVLALAVEDGLVAANPVAGIRAPRRIPKAKRFLTHAQVAALAAECGDDSVVLLTLAYTGVRAGELAAIRVSDVDFLRKRLEVSRSISYVSGHGMVTSSTKTHESRSVPLVASLVEPLSRLAAGKTRDALLFGGAAGEPWRVNNWRRRVFTPAVKRCRATDDQFPALTVHDMRAVAISLALHAGASLKMAQLLAGHQSGAVTADVYASLLPDSLDTVTEAMERQRQAECAPVVPPQADRPISETPSVGSVAGQRGSR